MSKTFTEEQVNEMFIKRLTGMMPRLKDDLLDIDKTFTQTESIEWGMLKQEKLDRDVYLRAIKETSQYIKDFKF